MLMLTLAAITNEFRAMPFRSNTTLRSASESGSILQERSAGTLLPTLVHAPG